MTIIIINQVQRLLKIYYAILLSVVFLGILSWCSSTKIKIDVATEIIPQSTWSTINYGQICWWLSKVYESQDMSNDIQFCETSSWDKYFMLEYRWFEWGSWRIFFDVQWNKIGSIEQFGDSDGSVPLYPTISWAIYYFNDCDSVDVKKCEIIDLYDWKRWMEWADGKIDQTCDLLVNKMNLNPPKTGKIREYRDRYAVCTNDKEIFYILFTGQKNIVNEYAPWKNYNIIQYFSITWDSLWYTTKFKFQKETGLLNYVTVLGNESEKVIYSINRCVNSSLDDCF